MIMSYSKEDYKDFLHNEIGKRTELLREFDNKEWVDVKEIVRNDSKLEHTNYWIDFYERALLNFN